jgi:hypothetical protein
LESGYYIERSVMLKRKCECTVEFFFAEHYDRQIEGSD